MLQRHRNIQRIVKALLLSMSLMSLSCVPQQTTPVESIRLVRKPIAWEYDLQAASESATRLKRPLLMYFYNDSCDWCLSLDLQTFSDPRISDIIDSEFVALRIDVETSEFAKLAGINMVPAVVIVIPTVEGGEPTASVVGYVDVDEFLSFLQKVLRRHS